MTERNADRSHDVPTTGGENATWDPPTAADPVVVGDLVDQVLGTIAGGVTGSLLVLRRSWRDVAGVKLAERSRPIAMDRGHLTIEVDDGAAASLLRFEVADVRRRASDVLATPVASVSLRVRRSR